MPVQNDSKSPLFDCGQDFETNPLIFFKLLHMVGYLDSNTRDPSQAVGMFYWLYSLSHTEPFMRFIIYSSCYVCSAHSQNFWVKLLKWM